MQFNQWIITTGVMTYITASLSRRHQIAFSHLPVPHLNFQIAFGNSQHVVVVLLFVFFSLDFSSYVLQDSPSCVLLWHSTSCLWLLPTPPPLPFTCSVFEPVFLPYSLSASLFSVWCWFVCVCSSCVTFFSSFCPLLLSGLLLVLYSVFFLFFFFFLGFSFI